MTDTYTETDTLTAVAADSDEAVALKLAEGLRDLRERRGLYDQMISELEAGRESARRKVAELQARLDTENERLADAANEAAIEFNDALSALVETGFATPKALASKGLGSLRIKK